MAVARTLLAFAAAPLAASLVLGLGLAASAGGPPGDLAAGTLILAFFTLFFTVPAAALGGGPALLLLKRVRLDRLPGFVVAGALVGLAAGGLFLSGDATPDVHREPGWTLLLMTAAAGALGGAVFGLVRGSPVARDRPGGRDAHVA